MNYVIPHRHPIEITPFLQAIYDQSPPQAGNVLNDIATLPKFNIPGVESIDKRVANAVIYTFSSLAAQKEFERKLDFWDSHLFAYDYKEEGPLYPFADPRDPTNPFGKICSYRTIITVDPAQLDAPFFDGANFFDTLVHWFNTRYPAPKALAEPPVDKIGAPLFPPSLIRSSTNPLPIG